MAVAPTSTTHIAKKEQGQSSPAQKKKEQGDEALL
jgi:hypothetical protein